MTMLLLAFIFAVGASALFAYAFLTAEPKAQPKIAQRTPDETAEPISVKLASQINALEEEIEKLTSDHRFLQEQLELAKKIESDLREELHSLIDKFQPQEKGDREVADRISGLEVKISEYKIELEKQSQIMLEMKDKTQAPGISEEEYKNLKRQLQAQEEKLARAEEVLRIIHAAG